MSIAIDSSTPAPSISSTVVITPPANSLVVLDIECCHFTTAGNNVASISDGTNTYTLLAYAYQSSNSYSGLYCFYYVSSPGSVTATITWVNAPTQGVNLVPIILTGAATTQNGAVATHGAGALESTSATPSVTVNATAAGSMIIAAQANFTSATSPTTSGDQSITFNGHSSFQTADGNGYWAQYEPTLTTGPGNVTISDTAPTGLDIAMCGAEILAVGGGGGTVPGPRRSQLMAMGVGRAAFERARLGDLWLPERFVR